MDLLNTHTYDGQLKYVKLYLKKYYDLIDNVEIDDLKIKINDGYQFLLENNKFDNTSNLTFQTLFNSIGTGANYDSTNDINADHLLYFCVYEILEKKDNDFVDLFIIQLNEMQSGMCPQGRTHRLIQILISFITPD